MKKIKAYVALFGESKKEAEDYLKYNANSVETKLLGVTPEDFYLFEIFVEENDLTNLYNLRDVTVYQ